jgi:hypothetical protein
MTLISTVPPIMYGYYVGFYSDMHAAVLNDEFEGVQGRGLDDMGKSAFYSRSTSIHKVQ